MSTPPSTAKPSGDEPACERLPSFRATAEALPIGVFVADSRGAFSYINQRAAAIVGIAPTEALGLGWAASIHADDRAPIIDAWQQAIRDRRPFALLARVLRRGGAIRWIEVRASAVREREGADAWVGLVDDISERRTSEEARLEAEASLRSTLNAVADLVFEVDTDERFVRFFQPRHRAELYAPPERFLGRSLAEVMPPEVVTLGRAAIERAKESGETQVIEYSLPMPESERWFQTRISPRHGPNGEIDGYVLVARDATERHHHLAELQLRRSEAEALAAAARAADAAKGDFLANMSHEMRTPLSAVIGLSELLRESDLDPEQERFVGLIAASARTLLGLVEDVLDFSRIEAGRLDLASADFDLRQVVEEALAPVSLRAAEKGIELHERIAADAPIALRGDADRLRQVILNLVDNAVKFTEVGEVAVEIRAAELAPGRRPALLVVVEDSGIGVPTDRLPQIFEPFRQADGSTSRRFGGTGLGLAIVRRILAEMGATIAVESEVGVGSRFTLTIPLVLAERAIAEPALAGRRIAVVDRHEGRLGWLRALVERWGGVVTPLVDPAELAARGPFDELLMIDARAGDELGRWLDAAEAPREVSVLVPLPELSTAWTRELRRRGHRILALPIHRSRLADALQSPIAPAKGPAERAGSWWSTTASRGASSRPPSSAAAASRSSSPRAAPRPSRSSASARSTSC
ncbi:MAG: PAS domain-containing protein [Myxococcales bacterium]|nr:PAS domain-containing protein [Myxococcales bacterium]